MLPRDRVIDPVAWIEHLDLVETMAEHLLRGPHQRERIEDGHLNILSPIVAAWRMRRGLPVVDVGETFARSPAWPEFSCLEASGAVEPVSPIRVDGVTVDFTRRDGSLVGYSRDPVPTLAELVDVAGWSRDDSPSARRAG